MKKKEKPIHTPVLNLTSGEIIFDKWMRQVALMNPEHAALSSEIVRRYNAHDDLVDIAHVMSLMDCLCQQAKLPSHGRDCPVLQAKTALILAGEMIENKS